MLSLYFFKKFFFSNRAGALIKKISLLSIASITVSVSCFLIVLYVMNGMNANIRHRVVSVEPHLIVFKNGENPQLNAEQIQKVMNSQLASFQQHLFLKKDVVLRTMDGQFRLAQGIGVSSEKLKFLHQQLKNLNKQQLLKNDLEYFDELQEGEIMMGIELARSLGVLEGDSLAVIAPEGLILPPGEIPPFEKIRVSKLMSTQLADLDSQVFYFNEEKTLQNFFKRVSHEKGLEFWIPDPLQSEHLKKQIQKDLPDYKVESWVDRNSTLFFALKVEKMMIGIFLAIAALVSLSSMISVMSLLISQLNKEIALVKVLGLSKNKTLHLFTLIGLKLAWIGIFLGIILGLGVSLYLEKNPLHILPDIYNDSSISALVDYEFLLYTLLVALIMSIIGAILPAQSTYNIEITKSLRQRGF